MEIEISPVVIAICGVGIAEDAISANFGLLNVQKCDHARDEGELDGGGDEEDGEGDVEGSLLEHSVFPVKF